MEGMNWELCCLCQVQKEDRLQTPKDEGLASLENDLNGFRALGVVPSGLKISWTLLDEGQGIADTLKKHNAKYHKACRTYCGNTRLRRLTEREESGDHISPKKLRSSSTVPSAQESPCCIICDGQDQQGLRKVETDNADTNLRNWAETSKNFHLFGKLTAQAADAHAADTYYHVNCYTNLRYAAKAEERRASAGPSTPCFNPIAIAQIVALVEDSKSIFKLSTLRHLYRNLMEEQGMPCADPREPHSTRFKEYILNLLPDWAEFCQGKGHEVYISSNQKVGDVLAEAHQTQLDQNDALLLMRAAVVLRKSFLQKQAPFIGSFSQDSLTSPVPGQLRSFLNILLQGPTMLQEEQNERREEQVQGRAKIANVIAQQIIYNRAKKGE